MTRKSVAVVEDDPIAACYVSKLLERSEDYEQCAAFSLCSDFRNWVASHQADVYLLDLELHDGHATDLIPSIRENDPDAKILVLTKVADASWISRCIFAGANGYIFKDEVEKSLLHRMRMLDMVDFSLCDMALRKALQQSLSPSPQDILKVAYSYGLQKRETEVLELLRDGASVKKIATHMNISGHTVNQHLRSIYRKLDVHSRAQAVGKVINDGVKNVR